MCKQCKTRCRCDCKVEKSRFFVYSGCSIYLYDYTCPKCKHTFDIKFEEWKKKR